MKCIKIQPSKLSGSLRIPTSKSHSIRAIYFASFAKGVSKIHHVLKSPDIEAMISGIVAMGSICKMQGNCLEIHGIGISPKTPQKIEVGNSGLAYRIFTAASALCSEETTITGDHSIENLRPIEPLLSALEKLGVGIKRSPLRIQGPIRNAATCVDASDSQMLSALLMTLPFAQNETTVEVIRAGEHPWIELTIDWLKRMEIPFERDGYRFFKLFPVSSIKPFEYTVPGDFSSAAFPVVAALLTDSSVTVEGVDFSDIQGDKEFFYWLKSQGAGVKIDNHIIKVESIKGLKGGVVDAQQFIDAIPILSVLACRAEDKTIIVNAAAARGKECDRLTAITRELKKMGACIEESSDGLTITPSKLKGARVNGCKDHRMAMALTVAGLFAEGETVVEDVSCIAKTYDRFTLDLRSLGAQLVEF